MTRTPATVALRVDVVRRLEAAAMAELPEGTLMQRAAAAIAVSAGTMLRETVGRVSGARVVLLIGSGDNGGDALYAGARLAARGARVDAVLVADRQRADLAARAIVGGLVGGRRPIAGREQRMTGAREGRDRRLRDHHRRRWRGRRRRRRDPRLGGPRRRFALAALGELLGGLAAPHRLRHRPSSRLLKPSVSP